jgi:hypothetical protein
MVLVTSLIETDMPLNSCVHAGKAIFENTGYVIGACSSSLVFPSNKLIPAPSSTKVACSSIPSE